MPVAVNLLPLTLKKFTMDHKQDQPDDETKAKFARMANRQTGIAVGAVVFGMGIGTTVSEAMAGQSFWLRILVVGAAAGFAAGIFAFLLGKFWRQ